MSERFVAFRFALDLNREQEAAARSHIGASRFTFNHMLATVKANLEQRAAERSYDIPNEELTPTVQWSHYSLRKMWNGIKDDVAPWWAENSKEAYSDGCERLAAALGNWAAARADRRKGTMGFPRFQSARGRQSVKFATGVIRVDDARHVTLPRLGRLRTHEATTKLLDRITDGSARVTNANLSYQRGHWFVSFTTHLQIPERAPSHPVGEPVGIDLGVKVLLVVASQDGRELERVPAPKHLPEAQRRLRALQRKAGRQVGPYDPTTKRRQEPSAGWRATQARISRAHGRVANLRENGLHQATTRLARTYGHIIVEDLNVKGMTAAGGARKRGLNRAILDASFSELSRMLTYKTQWAGGVLDRADRFFPSSKTCSACGTVKTKLSLAERSYECDTCGARIDRDLNAAINLARWNRAPAGVPGRHASGATSKSDVMSASGEEAGTCSSRSVLPQGTTR